MNKYLIGMLIGMAFSISLAALADSAQVRIRNVHYAKDINLKVNEEDKIVTFVNVEGTNYVKVRDIVDAVGGSLEWDSDTKTIKVKLRK